MLPHHTNIAKYLFAAFLIVIAAYAYFAMRNVLWGPQITIAAPEEGITVHEELIELSGTIKNVATLTIDGRPIALSSDGSYSTRLLLTPGINAFVFEASDKFGRSTRKRIQVLYTPRDPIPDERETPPSDDAKKIDEVVGSSE